MRIDGFSASTMREGGHEGLKFQKAHAFAKFLKS